MKHLPSFWILCLALILFSCNQNSKSVEAYDQNEASVAEMSNDYARSDVGLSKQAGYVGGDVPLQTSNSDKIIRTADIGLGVKDYAKSKLEVYAVIKSHKGYVSQENEQNEPFKVSNQFQIRVPNAEFDALIEKLTTGVGVRNVDFKRINSEDVGEQFTDLEIRLKNKKEVEQQYLTILKQAKTITDVLACNEQIRQLREEIDATEGRLRYLSNQISLSTINLNIYQELDGGNIIDKPGFLNKVGNALKGGWNGAVSFFIFFINVWPFWLIGGLVFYFVRKRWNKRKIAKS